MKKNNFIKLIVCVIAGFLFSIGMCMCLLPEWNLFTLGIILTIIGGIPLIINGIIALIKHTKNKSQINWKLIGKVTYAIISALIFGLGMSLIMVWNLIILGIVIGIIGITMLLFLIPMFLGFKK